jgi:DNA end-binding protein Ku
MARQTYWKGYLKLSLVTCPVVMSPATSDSAAVRFKMINGVTGNKVDSVYLDAVTKKPVPLDQQIKGYERAEDDYVLLEEEDFKAVALESTRTIDIDRFVPAASIDWVWFDAPHFLLPSDKVGVEAFAVIREAMRKSGMVGISRLVLQRRERAVLVEPRDNGLVLWTLHYGDEVRDEADYWEGLPEPGKADPSVTKAIGKELTGWSEEWVEDPVQTALLKLIASKKKSRRARPAASGRGKPKPSDNVISIVDALKRSLAAKPRANR